MWFRDVVYSFVRIPHPTTLSKVTIMDEFREKEKFLEMVINNTNPGGIWRYPNSNPPLIYTINEDGTIGCPDETHYDWLALHVTEDFSKEKLKKDF